MMLNALEAPRRQLAEIDYALLWPVTEGANSHARSGPRTAHAHAVWRAFTPVKHRRSKAPGPSRR